MYRSFQIAAGATLFAALSFSLWRISFLYSDLACVVLAPLVGILAISFRSLTIEIWKARVSCAVREHSTSKRWLAGRTRASVLTCAFTLGSVTLLAWQALRTSMAEAALMLIIVFISVLLYRCAHRLLLEHLHVPFARAQATTLSTWCLAIPATISIAVVSWSFAAIPGEIIAASFEEALQIGRSQLPPRDSWLSNIFYIFSSYEAARIWVVVQLRDYPVVGWIFSLDAALFAFILCRTGIIIGQFVEDHVLPPAQV